MLLFGVRLLLNLFEMMIYRRFLEVYIGRRKTGTELSLLLMGICAGVSSLVNLLENSTLNLLYTPIMLWLFALQYRVNAKSRVFAVFIYMGINFVTEPIGTYCICMPWDTFIRMKQPVTLYWHLC